MPNILRLLWRKVRDFCSDVAGRDGVDSCKSSPFDRKGLAEVDYACFGGVVGTLDLRDVDDVAWVRQ